MEAGECISVLVVDDDPFVRAALKSVLAAHEGMRWVGEATNGVEAQDAVIRLRPRVVLIDLEMPVADGIHAIEVIASWPDAPAMIALTNHENEARVAAVIRAGGSGYLTKSSGPDVIRDAIVTAAGGDWVLDPTLLRRVVGLFASMQGATGTSDPRLEQLTDREREIADAVATGLSNQQIAKELYLSLSTVKTNVSRILTKLHLTNRVQIALLVHGLAHPGGDGSRGS